jgi:hypothetical protein
MLAFSLIQDQKGKYAFQKDFQLGSDGFVGSFAFGSLGGLWWRQ